MRRRDAVPTGSSSRRGARLQPRGQRLPAPSIGGSPLLRRLLARLHLGDAREAAGIRYRRRSTSRPSSPAPRARSTCEVGPDGRLYYADFDGGTIRRIDYTGSNQPPVAAATADPLASDAPPVDVDFDASGLSDPDAEPGDVLSYAWDLDGDGAYDDSSSPTPTHTYAAAGVHTASVEVTDAGGASSRAAVTIEVGHRPEPDDRATRGRHDLGRRRADRVRRLGDRRRGWAVAADRPRLEADPPPLPVELPRTSASGVCGHRFGLFQRARPRLPVASRAGADGDGPVGRHRLHEHGAAAEDRRPAAHLVAAGARRHAGGAHGGDAVRRNAYRGVADLAECSEPSNPRRPGALVDLVVRRRCPLAQRRRVDVGHLPRDVHRAREAADRHAAGLSRASTSRPGPIVASARQRWRSTSSAPTRPASFRPAGRRAASASSSRMGRCDSTRASSERLQLEPAGKPSLAWLRRGLRSGEIRRPVFARVDVADADLAEGGGA